MASDAVFPGCLGSDTCCTETNQCEIGEGDCDSDEDCKGKSFDQCQLQSFNNCVYYHLHYVNDSKFYIHLDAFRSDCVIHLQR